jgi:hypothetical protein
MRSSQVPVPRRAAMLGLQTAHNRGLRVIATQRDRAQPPFGSVVIDLQATVVAVTCQCRPQSECVADGRRRIRLAGQPGQRDFEPVA